LDTCISITVSTGTLAPAGGLVPITSPAGRGLSTAAWLNLLKPYTVRFFCAESAVCPVTSGTCLLDGPEPTITAISLVIADVWLAGGLVPMTLSFISGVDGELTCLKRVNPADFSFLTAAA